MRKMIFPTFCFHYFIIWTPQKQSPSNRNLHFAFHPHFPSIYKTSLFVSQKDLVAILPEMTKYWKGYGHLYKLILIAFKYACNSTRALRAMRREWTNLSCNLHFIPMQHTACIHIPHPELLSQRQEGMESHCSKSLNWLSEGIN